MAVIYHKRNWGDLRGRPTACNRQRAAARSLAKRFSGDRAARRLRRACPSRDRRDGWPPRAGKSGRSACQDAMDSACSWVSVPDVTKRVSLAVNWSDWGERANDSVAQSRPSGRSENQVSASSACSWVRVPPATKRPVYEVNRASVSSERAVRNADARVACSMSEMSATRSSNASELPLPPPSVAISVIEHAVRQIVARIGGQHRSGHETDGEQCADGGDDDPAFPDVANSIEHFCLRWAPPSMSLVCRAAASGGKIDGRCSEIIKVRERAGRSRNGYPGPPYFRPRWSRRALRRVGARW